MRARAIASFKIWIVIYPSITLFLQYFGLALSPLPLYQRTFILTLALVPWTVFAGLPAVEYIAGFARKKTELES